MMPELYKLLHYGTLPRVKVYYDTLNDTFYVCDATHGSALTDAVWKVRKYVKTLSYGAETAREVGETDNYDNLATDLSTVQSLIYN